jgi:hypothetical protein
MTYVLPRQDYFELIPSCSNNFQPQRGLLGARLERFPNPTGLFVDLNVYVPVQDSIRDLSGC